MLKKCVLLLVTGWFAAPAVIADTIQLKDKAAVIGKVLAEKRDQVAVDVGYTVLVIPRNQITKISKTGDTDSTANPTAIVAKPNVSAPLPGAVPAPSSRGDAEPKPGFY